jgi:surface polysaccharide O-acyltransferase-like enzyme
MKKEYNLAVDVLRIIAILAVILIHTTTKTLERTQYNIATIPFTLFLNQSAIFAVPLFFLISGFVLELNYKQLDYFTYFKKRSSKIIVPYLFWALFYYYMYPKAQIPHASLPYLIISGQTSYQLYFIPAIIILYLLFPLLHKCISFFSKWYVLILSLTIQLWVLWQSYYIHDFDIEPSLRVLLLSFVMFPLGMVASHYQEKILQFSKKYIFILCGFMFFSMLFAFLQSWYLYEKTKNIHSFYSQYQPLVIPYTLALFATMFHFFYQKQHFKKFIMLLANVSFFVFLSHIAIFYTIWSWIGYKYLFLGTRATMGERMFYDIFFFALITVLSFALGIVIHKIPYLSKITG